MNEDAHVTARSPRPILFALMTLPAGIAQGFLTVTLPFIARGAGISVLMFANHGVFVARL